MTANAQTITVNGNGAATPVVRAIDEGGPTLVLNLDPTNTIYVGSNTAIGPGNPNETAPIGPNSGSIFDGTQDVYATCGNGLTAQVGIYPGVTNYFQLIAVIVSTLIIAASAGNGLFVYNGVPAAGNLVGSWSPTGGTDQFGNMYPAGLSVAQNLTVGITGQSQVQIVPNQNSAFNITTSISGLLEAVAALSTTDPSEVLPGFLGSLLLGLTSKMSTILSSPVGNGNLQSNPDFTNGSLTGWSAFGGTLAAISGSGGPNPWAAQLTANVLTANAIEGSPDPFTVTPGDNYVVSAWVLFPTGGTMQLGMDFELNGTYVSTVTNNITVPAGVWTPITTTITAPASGINQGYARVGLGSASIGETYSASAITAAISGYGGQGAAIVLKAQNDGGTDTAGIDIGIVTTPDDSTEVFTPILSIYPYAVVLYGGASGITVVTKTSGSGTINGLPATVKAEAWGAGASLSGVSAGASALGGCGSGGYSQEPALATAGSVTYSVPASANGLGGAPPDCTIVGSAVTVTAHSGFAGTGSGFGNGAAASGNTIAFAGARGGNPSFADPGGGGGGAGSAGPGGAGNHGDAGSPSGGGAAGTGASGGANGGAGGNPSSNGGAGSAPGGGGGGGGTDADGRIGGPGQIRLTYSSGTPPVIASWSTVAFTDQFGTVIQAGTILPGPGDGNQYNSGPLTLYNTSTVDIDSTSPITIFTLPVAVGTYRVHGILSCTNAAAGTLQPQSMRFINGTGTISVLRVQVRSAQEGSTASTSAFGQITSENGDPSAVRTPALSEIFTMEFDGVIVISAAGTITLAGRNETSSTDATYTVNEFSFVDLTPAIAVAG